MRGVRGEVQDMCRVVLTASSSGLGSAYARVEVMDRSVDSRLQSVDSRLESVDSGLQSVDSRLERRGFMSWG